MKKKNIITIDVDTDLLKQKLNDIENQLDRILTKSEKVKQAGFEDHLHGKHDFSKQTSIKLFEDRKLGYSEKREILLAIATVFAYKNLSYNQIIELLDCMKDEIRNKPLRH